MTDPTIAFKGEYLHVTLIDSPYGVYEVITGPSLFGVTVMVVSGDEVLLVKQYRPPVGKSLWELPGGAADDLTELAFDAARELEEEANVTVDASQLILLASTHPMPSMVECTVNNYFVRLPDDYDKSVVKHQESEIEEAAWFNINDIIEDAKSGGDTFTSVLSQVLLAKMHGLV